MAFDSETNGCKRSLKPNVCNHSNIPQQDLAHEPKTTPWRSLFTGHWKSGLNTVKHGLPPVNGLSTLSMDRESTVELLETVEIRGEQTEYTNTMSPID